MNTKPGMKKIGTTVLALILWLITIGLGLEAIYATHGLFALLYVRLGGDPGAVALFTPWLVLLLAVIFLFFFIMSSEYHRKRIGQPVSWRLFAWSIAVEAGLVILFYLL